MQRIFYPVLIVYVSLMVSCSPKYTRYIKDYSTATTSSDTSNIPDYSNLVYWAAHPWKKDLSDSLPVFFRKNYQQDSAVDVFFIHPTTLTADERPEWNADVNDAGLNAKTDYGSILYQASVFNESRVFAPRYRQAHLRAYYTEDTALAMQAFDTAYADVSRAFRYYLDHYNNGRPFIIASHSQGTTHALRLIKEYFKDGELKKQLVAAYLIGMYIPESVTAYLPLCRDSTETGCVCGWRTYQRDYTPELLAKENGSCLITNPLTWTSSTEYAPKKLNTRSVLRTFDKTYTHLTDAQITRGILWISKPKFPGSFLLKMKNYHIADLNLFYGNIRHNARTRIDAYLNNQSNP